MESPTIIRFDTLLGFIAFCAIGANPERNIADLPAVLTQFRDLTEKGCQQAREQQRDALFEQGYGSFDEDRLRHFVGGTLMEIPEVKAWGERPNGREGNEYVGRGIEPPAPEDTSTDLSDLVWQIASETMQYARREEAKNLTISNGIEAQAGFTKGSLLALKEQARQLENGLSVLDQQLPQPLSVSPYIGTALQMGESLVETLTRGLEKAASAPDDFWSVKENPEPGPPPQEYEPVMPPLEG